MSRPAWLLMSVMLLVAAACSDGGSEATPEAGEATESPDPPVSEAPPSDERPDQTTPGSPNTEPDTTLPGGPAGLDSLEELGGRLAITDRTTLLLIDPTGANGEFVDEVADGLIAQPTWSPDGAEIAWARLDRQAAGSSLTPGSVERMTLPDDTAGLEGGERTSTPTGDMAPVYLQWSDDASRIALLRNGSDGIELLTIREDQGPELEAVGAPVYVAWGPDNEALAWHLGTDLQVRRGGSLDTVAVTEGTFTAPDWLTNDEVMAVRGSKLVLVDPDNGFVNEVAEVELPTQFVLHPESGRVAFLGPGSDVLTIRYQEPDDPPEPEEPESDDPDQPDEPQRDPVLQVLDLRSENLALVTADPVLAWEWSPDGQRLAYLARSDFDEEKLRWFFWQDGRVVGATSEFWLTPTERSVYLPFFAQYTQSHTRWAPDSSGFAFAGIVDDTQGIWVHVIDETPQSILVADGDFVTWSPETVSNGSGISPL